MGSNDGIITIEDAKLKFLNFSGRPDKYNPIGGIRTFSVVIPEDKIDVDMLLADGWNVKRSNPRDDDDADSFVSEARLQVKVAFGKYPPEIWVTTSGGRILYREDIIDLLDNVDIKSVDLMIRPFKWNDRGDIKAYLKKMYMRIEEDVLAKKWANVPILGSADLPEE